MMIVLVGSCCVSQYPSSSFWFQNVKPYFSGKEHSGDAAEVQPTNVLVWLPVIDLEPYPWQLWLWFLKHLATWPTRNQTFKIQKWVCPVWPCICGWCHVQCCIMEKCRRSSAISKNLTSHCSFTSNLGVIYCHQLLILSPHEQLCSIVTFAQNGLSCWEEKWRLVLQ